MSQRSSVEVPSCVMPSGRPDNSIWVMRSFEETLRNATPRSNRSANSTIKPGPVWTPSTRSTADSSSKESPRKLGVATLISTKTRPEGVATTTTVADAGRGTEAGTAAVTGAETALVTIWELKRTEAADAGPKIVTMTVTTTDEVVVVLAVKKSEKLTTGMNAAEAVATVIAMTAVKTVAGVAAGVRKTAMTTVRRDAVAGIRDRQHLSEAESVPILKGQCLEGFPVQKNWTPPSDRPNPLRPVSDRPTFSLIPTPTPQI